MELFDFGGNPSVGFYSLISSTVVIIVALVIFNAESAVRTACAPMDYSHDCARYCVERVCSGGCVSGWPECHAYCGFDDAHDWYNFTFVDRLMMCGWRGSVSTRR